MDGYTIALPSNPLISCIFIMHIMCLPDETEVYLELLF
jgi:hypothetical protein